MSRDAYHLHVELPKNIKPIIRREFPTKGDLANFVRRVIVEYITLTRDSDKLKLAISKHKNPVRAAIMNLTGGNDESE